MSTQPNETPTDPTTDPTTELGAPAPEPQSPELGAPAAEPTTEPETGSAAEKRYRLQLREAEAERDSLRSVVESMRTAEVERLAFDRLASPKLLWTLGKTTADLLTDDGTGVDPKKVDALCSAVVDTYGQGVAAPLQRRRNVVYAPLEGRNATGSARGSQEKGLAGAFTPDAWPQADF